VVVQNHWPIMLLWLELREGPFDPEWHTAEKIAGAQCGTGELSGENIAWARQAIASLYDNTITLAHCVRLSGCT
jgi:hypothetical protein